MDDYAGGHIGASVIIRPPARCANAIPIGTASAPYAIGSTPTASFSTTTPGACSATDRHRPDTYQHHHKQIPKSVVLWHHSNDAQIIAQCAMGDQRRELCASRHPIADIGRAQLGGMHSMMANWVPTPASGGPNSGRILDTARGILIGLRRCRSDAAFNELHSAAERHKVPVFAMAWALVHLAGEGEKTPSFMDAQSAARHEWGPLFAAPAAAT